MDGVDGEQGRKGGVGSGSGEMEGCEKRQNVREVNERAAGKRYEGIRWKDRDTNTKVEEV